MDTAFERTCICCLQRKPISQFGRSYHHGKGADPVRNVCKGCYATRQRRYYAAHRAEEAAWSKQYRRNNAERIRERNRRYRRKERFGKLRNTNEECVLAGLSKKYFGVGYAKLSPEQLQFIFTRRLLQATSARVVSIGESLRWYNEFYAKPRETLIALFKLKIKGRKKFISTEEEHDNERAAKG
jgi:hypothetical protein